MIIDTCNKIDLFSELTKEREYISDIVYKKHIKQFYRIGIKSTNFPLKFVPIEFKTKNNNNIFFLPCYHTKRSVKDGKISGLIYCIRNTEKRGIDVISFINGNIICVYTTHFFKRYKERFFKC